ncbi:MAG: hypothetical protein HY815_12635 [Candidatus Riflebacteria bacterium]|nr:hypothetical protein [Candidatus Riflebacteria bacterium]
MSEQQPDRSAGGSTDVVILECTDRSAPVTFSKESYMEPVNRMRRRFAGAMCLAFGGGIFVAIILPRLAFFLDHLGALLTVLMVSAAAGMVTGYLQSLLWGRFLRTQVERFLQHPREYLPSPPGLDAEGRVLELVSYRVQGMVFVWGMTVLTRSALWFLPENSNWRWHKDPLRIPLELIEDVELIRTTGPDTWIPGAEHDVYPGVLRISFSGTSAILNVGTMEMAANLVDMLQRRLPGAADVEKLIQGQGSERP